MGLSAFYFVTQIGIYSMGLCILPFNSLQLAFGINGTCNRSLPLVVVSFLLDTFCVQKSIDSGLFASCNGLGYGVIFLMRELCELKW